MGTQYHNMVISFIDDNSTTRNYHTSTTVSNIIMDAYQATEAWRHLLSATGGEISIDKMKIQIIYWEQTQQGYQLRNIIVPSKSTESPEIISATEHTKVSWN